MWPITVILFSGLKRAWPEDTVKFFSPVSISITKVLTFYSSASLVPQRWLQLLICIPHSFKWRLMVLKQWLLPLLPAELEQNITGRSVCFRKGSFESIHHRSSGYIDSTWIMLTLSYPLSKISVQAQLNSKLGN